MISVLAVLAQWPINRKWIVVVSPKLAGAYPMTHVTLRTSFKVKRSKVKVTGRLTQTHKVCHIFWTVTPKTMESVNSCDVDSLCDDYILNSVACWTAVDWHWIWHWNMFFFHWRVLIFLGLLLSPRLNHRGLCTCGVLQFVCPFVCCLFVPWNTCCCWLCVLASQPMAVPDVSSPVIKLCHHRIYFSCGAYLWLPKHTILVVFVFFILYTGADSC